MTAGPTKEALAVLSRHADHIQRLLDDGAVFQDAFPRAAIMDLHSASAIRPAGPDTWRLQPRLREYLQEHHQLLSPFQALTVIGPKVTALRDLREEILNAGALRDTESVRLLMDSMATTIYDIADSTERNLSFLTSMVSLRFGAVKDLQAKVRQNRWYDRQANILMVDLTRLGERAADLLAEADAMRWDVVPLLRREIMARLQGWKHTLSDLLDRLSKQVYSLRKVEVNLRRLARADAVLTQKPGWRGPDMPVPERIPDVLLRASIGSIRAHADPRDDDHAVRGAMASAAKSLPPPRVRQTPAPRPSQFIQPPDPEHDEPPTELDPYVQVLAPLKRTILQAHQVGVATSLLQFQREHPAAAMLRAPAATALPPRIWLMFALWALEGRPHRVAGREVRFAVQPVLNAPRPGRREANTFRDALVSLEP